MTALRPMLATPGPLPSGDQWSFEVKYDGIRALIEIDEQRALTITTRAGNVVTETFPELAAIADALDGSNVVLDGEIVAMGDDGLPSFHRLQERLGVFGPDALRRSVRVPVLFVVFDILAINGMSTCDLPLSSRRALLDRLEGLHSGAHWRRITTYEDGEALLELTRTTGIEGVVAKRDDARYLPGQRSPSWIKVRNLTTDEFVIGGWVPGEGRRQRTIGALLLGLPENDEPGAPLRWIGKVGTGFTDAMLDELHALLAPDVRLTRPFTNDPVERTAVYVEPRHRCLVEYREWSPTGVLRFPSWRGLVTPGPELVR
jgi:bifunctional non-homologous end joining protein LigD